MPVSQPVQREVTDYAEFTGQTKGIFSNDIIPQVTGYLVQMPFEEGAEVKKGDLLFEVDPRPYKAQLDQAQGQVDLNKAQLKLARTTSPATGPSNASSPGSVSRSYLIRSRLWSTRPCPGSMPPRGAWSSTGSTTNSPRSCRRSTARAAATT